MTTFSQITKDLAATQNLAVSILEGVSRSVTSSDETVIVTAKDSSGNEIKYNLPSFGYLQAQIKRIDDSLKNLTDFSQKSQVRMEDGTYRRVFLAKPVATPKPIGTIESPVNFSYKNNWFFEDFLSPALRIRLNVTPYLEKSSRAVVCKRLILNLDSDEKKSFFSSNYNLKNNILYTKLIVDLQKAGIDFFVDEEQKHVSPNTLQYNGNFSILNYKDVDFSLDGTNVKKRKYWLDKITYSDNYSVANNSMELKVGDRLSYMQTIYEIESVNRNERTVILKRLSGYDNLQVGVDILSFYNIPNNDKYVEIGIGHNEYTIVFLKSIDFENNILCNEWSPGIGFYSNELVTNTNKGLINLDAFYKSDVIDYGQLFMNLAKEKVIPSVYGLKPNTPVLNVADYKVVRVNDHKYNNKEVDDIRKKAAEKIKIESEVTQLQLNIEKKKEELNSTKFKTETERRRTVEELESLIKSKTSKTSLHNSIVKDIANLSTQNPDTLDKPKYKIRGFFNIPVAKTHEKTGPQEIIQFLVSYRYLKLDGNSTGAIPFENKDSNGKIVRSTYTNWIEYKSEIRTKKYNATTGLYEWEIEDLENPEKTNVNQIDIPITRGEKVEIRVKSISEAGWPINPLLSDWSEPIIIDFPVDLLKDDEASNSIANSQLENLKVQFEEELNKKGLDLHLADSFTKGENYYSHSSSSISSGFFTPEGNNITLFDQLRKMESIIKDLTAKLEAAKGKLSIYVVDEDKNKFEVKNGDVLSLFGGYYLDETKKLPESERKGAIINKKWKLLVTNSEATPLELVSRFPGGLNKNLYDSSNYTNIYGEPNINPVNDLDYLYSRRYDRTPINNLSVHKTETNNGSKISSAMYQSQQMLSQWMYSRYTDIGLKEISGDLYYDDVLDKQEAADKFNVYTPGKFHGVGTTSPTVWDVNNTSANTAGGYLNNFCIHTDHPLYSSTITYDKLQNPDIVIKTNKVGSLLQSDYYTSIETTREEAVAEFMHAKYASKESNEINGKKQLSYRNNFRYKDIVGMYNLNTFNFSTDFILSSTNALYNNDIEETMLSSYKYGFKDNDRYLIGKYTCGSYFYMSPASVRQLLVDGTDYRAKMTLEAPTGEKISDTNNKNVLGIEIPLIFQYRMTDYYSDSNITTGIVGGYDSDNVGRETEGKKNLVYTKRLGFDIYVKNETPFEFDIEITSKYKSESNTQAIDTIGKAVSVTREGLSVSKDILKNIR